MPDSSPIERRGSLSLINRDGRFLVLNKDGTVVRHFKNIGAGRTFLRGLSSKRVLKFSQQVSTGLGSKATFIGGSIKEREAREEKFRRDTLFTNLMTGQTVPSISDADARFVLARLDAAPGNNKAVRDRLEKQLASGKTDGTKNSPSHTRSGSSHRPRQRDFDRA